MPCSLTTGYSAHALSNPWHPDNSVASYKKKKKLVWRRALLDGVWKRYAANVQVFMEHRKVSKLYVSLLLNKREKSAHYVEDVNMYFFNLNLFLSIFSW